eukprot:3394641-Karenia_brevis.AAC.1
MEQQSRQQSLLGKVMIHISTPVQRMQVAPACQYLYPQSPQGEEQHSGEATTAGKEGEADEGEEEEGEGRRMRIGKVGTMIQTISSGRLLGTQVISFTLRVRERTKGAGRARHPNMGKQITTMLSPSSLPES